MTYQTFVDKKGASDSVGKLTALQLPNLKGKSFLDIGCNEGFFCEYAKKEGATKIVGIDYDKEYIRMANERNPDIDFRCQDWENIGDEKFDVILFASSLHYVKNPVLFFNKLLNNLTDDGVLVLECGLSNPNMVAPSDVEHIFRHDGIKIYPTYSTLKKWMRDFSLRWICESVMQRGDTMRRFVVHARKRQTRVVIISGNPHTGKTNFLDRFKADVVIHADSLKELIELENIYDYWNNTPNKEQFESILRNLIEINRGVDCIVVEGYILKDLDLRVPGFKTICLKMDTIN